MEKVWIDISDHRQARLLAYVAKALEGRMSVTLTCSGLPEPRAVLGWENVGFEEIDDRSSDTLSRYGKRIMLLSEFAQQTSPDLLITDLDPAAVRTAFGLGIPTWTFFRRTHDPLFQSLDRMSYPLCDRVFTSSFYDSKELVSAGVQKDAVTSFRGWNECYLKDLHSHNQNDHNVDEMPRIMVRTPLNGNGWIADLLLELGERRDVNVTLLGQGDYSELVSSFEELRVVRFMPSVPPLGQHVFIGWGRMLAESFVLGVPTVGVEGVRHQDLSMLYDNIRCETSPKGVANACCELLENPHRTHFDLYSKAITAPFESPVSCLVESL